MKIRDKRKGDLSVLALPQWVVDSPICVECQGKCCKHYPGSCWPDDVKPLTAERIIEMVRHERYAIDWYEGDPRLDGDLGCVYFLRPAIRGAASHLDPSWGGVCVFLMDTGCSLPADKRPRECLAIIPSDPIDGHCLAEDGYAGKDAAAMAWIPHQNMMEEVVNELYKTGNGGMPRGSRNPGLRDK